MPLRATQEKHLAENEPCNRYREHFRFPGRSERRKRELAGLCLRQPRSNACLGLQLSNVTPWAGPRFNLAEDRIHHVGPKIFQGLTFRHMWPKPKPISIDAHLEVMAWNFFRPSFGRGGPKFVQAWLYERLKDLGRTMVARSLLGMHTPGPSVQLHSPSVPAIWRPATMVGWFPKKMAFPATQPPKKGTRMENQVMDLLTETCPAESRDE